MKKIIITSFLFLSVIGYAQKYELGKVTVEELKEKKCPSDTSAVAAVLFNVGRTTFDYSGDDGFSITTEITTKIKIYKKEGYEYANHSEKMYMAGKGTEKVMISKAVTYNLVGDKIEKSKLGSDGEFTEKVNKYWNRKKFTMPNVKEGSIIEYKITIVSPFFFNFPDWEFQKDIPVNYSEYTTDIPEYFIYNARMKGVIAPKIEKTSQPKTIIYSYNEEGAGGMNAPAPRRITTSMDFRIDRTKYSIENIPALKDEGFVNNIANYQTTLLHELSGTRYPHSPFKNYNTDWESVVKGIYDNDNFGSELGKTGYFEKDIDDLLKDVKSSEEKIGTIFSYVKSRMNWDEFTGYNCDAGVKRAYSDKKGNVAEINLMLTAMLRYAGFNSNPVILSTRSNGISLFPSTSAYNYVIASVELNNQVILLDATNKYSIPDILPTRDLNWFGRLIRKDGSSAEIDLMPKSSSKEVINLMANVNDKGEVAGKIRRQYFDYNALIFRINNNKVNKDSYVEKLEKRYKGLEVGTYDVQNNDDLSQPIVENYDFNATNSVEIIGDKMYLSPLIFFATTENPFKQEEREYPIDFVYPNQDKYNISLTIPDGYVIETLPQAKAVAMPDNLASLKYMISSSGNKIQLVYTMDINQAIIGSEYYGELKAFFKEAVDKETEKIVLKKG